MELFTTVMGVEGVKLGKLFGRIGFVIGFVGPVLFYAVPYAFESGIACPLCPYIDAPFMRPLGWLEIGLTVGLFQGLIFALSVSRLGTQSRIKQPPKTI